MAALPYMQLYVADYLADTAHLNAAQHGAYLLLIMNYWQRGKPLKNSNERLANVARMSSEEWECSKDLLAEFFVVTEDEWIHERVETDLDAVRAKSSKASNAGKASAQRRLEQKDNERSTTVEQTLNHTDTDTDKDKDKDIKTNVASQRSTASPPVPVCPHQAIIGLYHDILPELAQVKFDRWEGSEASKDLVRRWRESLKHQHLDFWKRFLTHIRSNDHWMGANGFKTNLRWFLKRKNFDKVLEWRA